MLRSACILLLLSLSSSAGCAMCASCDDYSYAAVGGRWQRDDPMHGRVGSLFAPAGPMVVGDAYFAGGTPRTASPSQDEFDEERTPESPRGLLDARGADESSEERPEYEEPQDLTGISTPLYPYYTTPPQQRSILRQ